MFEPTEVDAHFAVDGSLRVHSFTWHGHHHTVTSTGRQWRTPTATHCLVMLPGEQVFELRYMFATGLWQAKRMGEGSLSA